MYGEQRATLDCQSCGELLRVLSDSEAQQVAHYPHNYILFCANCKAQGHHIDPEFRI